MLQIIIVIGMWYLDGRFKGSPAPGAYLRQVDLAKTTLANHHLTVDFIGADNGQPVWQAMVDCLFKKYYFLNIFRILWNMWNKDH